ncbi:hypothetical protein FRC11_008153 [Ceratobasidium sp. 423]|nr:hypothetical protein FRC11_008153 [Ceratobasidium sp. 423]
MDGPRRASRAIAGYTPLYEDESHPDLWQMEVKPVVASVGTPYMGKVDFFGCQIECVIFPSAYEENIFYVAQNPDPNYKPFWEATRAVWDVEAFQGKEQPLKEWVDVDLTKARPWYMSNWAMKLLRLEHGLPPTIPEDPPRLAMLGACREGIGANRRAPKTEAEWLAIPLNRCDEGDDECNDSDAESIYDHAERGLPTSSSWDPVTKKSTTPQGNVPHPHPEVIKAAKAREVAYDRKRREQARASRTAGVRRARSRTPTPTDDSLSPAPEEAPEDVEMTPGEHSQPAGGDTEDVVMEDIAEDARPPPPAPPAPAPVPPAPVPPAPVPPAPVPPAPAPAPAAAPAPALPLSPPALTVHPMGPPVRRPAVRRPAVPPPHAPTVRTAMREQSRRLLPKKSHIIGRPHLHLLSMSGKKRRMSTPTDGKISQDAALGTTTTRVSKRPRTRVVSFDQLLSGMKRHNLKLLERASEELSVVRLSNFDLDEFCTRVMDGNIPMHERKPQPGLAPLRLCKEDGPRIIVDKNENFVMFYCPQFWGTSTQEYLMEAIETLDAAHPLQKDASRANADKRAVSGSAEGSRRAEWGLHTHGLGQQFKYDLRPSLSLRAAGGRKGVQARQNYLDTRALNDGHYWKLKLVSKSYRQKEHVG